MMKTTLAAAVATLVLSGQFAQAATCSTVEASKVTVLDTSVGNGCEVFRGNDKVATINSNAVFGFSDWVYLAKDNTDKRGFGRPDEGDSAAFSLTGTDQAGTWSIHDTGYSDYLFVVKASSSYLTYRVSDLTGTYASAVTNKKGKTKDISHISLYARGTAVPTPSPMPVAAAPIPVPAALPLVVSGIGALGLLRMRRRKD